MTHVCFISYSKTLTIPPDARKPSVAFPFPPFFFFFSVTIFAQKAAGIENIYWDFTVTGKFTLMIKTKCVFWYMTLNWITYHRSYQGNLTTGERGYDSCTTHPGMSRSDSHLPPSVFRPPPMEVCTPLPPPSSVTVISKLPTLLPYYQHFNFVGRAVVTFRKVNRKCFSKQPDGWGVAARL